MRRRYTMPTYNSEFPTLGAANNDIDNIDNSNHHHHDTNTNNDDND